MNETNDPEKTLLFAANVWNETAELSYITESYWNENHYMDTEVPEDLEDKLCDVLGELGLDYDLISEAAIEVRGENGDLSAEEVISLLDGVDPNIKFSPELQKYLDK